MYTYSYICISLSLSICSIQFNSMIQLHSTKRRSDSKAPRAPAHDFVLEASNWTEWSNWVELNMAPRWHHGTIAPRALKKKETIIVEKMSKSKSSILGRFKGLGGMGVCGNHAKWLQLRACKIWWISVRKTPVSWPNYFFEIFEKVLLGLSAFRAPHGGAI